MVVATMVKHFGAWPRPRRLFMRRPPNGSTSNNKGKLPPQTTRAISRREVRHMAGAMAQNTRPLELFVSECVKPGPVGRIGNRCRLCPAESWACIWDGGATLT